MSKFFYLFDLLFLFILYFNSFKLINTLEKLYFIYYKLILLTKVNILIISILFAYFNQ